MTPPEKIDVSLSLLDGNAMSEFVEELKIARGLIDQAKDDMSNLSKPTPAAQESTAGKGASLPTQAPPQPGKSSASSDRVVQTNQERVVEATNGTNLEEVTAEDIYRPGKLAMLKQATLGIGSHVPLLSHTIGKADDGTYQFRPGEEMQQAAIYGVASSLTQPIMSATNSGISLLNPFSAAQSGYASGLPGGSGGWLGLPIQQPFGAGTIQHYESTGSSILDAIGTPGYGTAEAIQANNQLTPAFGWGMGLGDQRNIKEMLSHMRSAEFEAGVLKGLPQEAMMSSIDQMVRFGTAGEKEVEESFRGLADTARGARMSLEEFNAGLDQVAEELTHKGLTFAQGRIAAKNFSATTNMAPQTMSTLMNNGFWQGQAMGMTGLPLEAQGLVAQNPAMMNSVTAETIRMMESATKGMGWDTEVHTPGYTKTISGDRVGEQMAAYSMDMTLDQYRAWKDGLKTDEIQGNLYTMVGGYNHDLAKLNHQYENNKINEAQWHRRQIALGAGTGKYSGEGHASWEEIRAQLERPNSGFTPAQIQELSTMDASDRAERLKQIAERSAPDRLRDDSKHMIGFTGLAEKMLKEVLPGYQEKMQAKRAANRGVGDALMGLGTISAGTDSSGLFNAPPAGGSVSGFPVEGIYPSG